jgi:RNA polymerase primary sigma factor
MSTPDLAEELHALVFAHPGTDKLALARLVTDMGYRDITPSDVNAILYRFKDIEWRPGPGSPRLWFPKDGPGSRSTVVPKPPAPPSPAPRRASGDLELFPWQQRALSAWQAQNHRGVIEAVTGAGKTRVAIAAAADVVQAGGGVVIVVPSKDLMRQWRGEIDRLIVGKLGLSPSVGFMGDGGAATLASHDVVIATAQSGSRWQLDPPALSLLIADECHHYGADTWSQVLEAGFTRRLGLTATYDREDNGVREFLDPYFGGVCASIDYEEAIADGVIADFKIAFVGSSFDPAERLAYDDAATKAGRYRAKLINEWKVPAEPFGAFMLGVNRLRHANVAEGSKLAGFYLSAFTKRRAVMAEARGKFEAILELAPAVRAAERTIVFAQTKDAAASVVRLLSAEGVRGVVLTSAMDMDERRIVFAGFENGTHELVAAPKLLDEGIDVPAADLAIIVATSRSRRQLIQRMGRVVRKKADGRLARVVILYVEGTAEDPQEGAQEDFLDLIAGSAKHVQIFASSTKPAEVVRYLNDWTL